MDKSVLHFPPRFRRPAFVRIGAMAVVAAAAFAAAPSARAGDAPPAPSVDARDSRVELRWDPPNEGRFVYRAFAPDGYWRRLTDAPVNNGYFCDFVGADGQETFYRVTRPLPDGKESPPSAVVSATPKAMDEEALMTSVQAAAFRYFWEWGVPGTGMIRERQLMGEMASAGATGFGLMALVVGAERKFVARAAAAERVRSILDFLENKAERYHGAWAHWMHGRTGKTSPFSRMDDGADLVETAFLAQGFLTVRQYFDKNDPLEKDVRERADRLWKGIEWDRFQDPDNPSRIYWHWSPNHAFGSKLTVGGHFNECLLVYILGIASPTHPLPVERYNDSWISKEYPNGKTFHGIKQPVGFDRGGPLFFTHYSFLGFDPRAWTDQFTNYHDNNRAISRINQAYAVATADQHFGYGPRVWGITASDGPDGYRPHSPGGGEWGVVAPTAALSAMPYTPELSLPAMRYFYYGLGPKLWGDCGFKDAFHLGRGWFAEGYIGIDEGPIVIMMENYRTGLCWKVFMSSPEVKSAMERIRATLPK